MDMSFEDQIRERAYQIWLAGGMADGQAHEHWACAEQTVLDEIGAKGADAAEPVVIITKAEPKPAKPRKAAAKPAVAKPAVAAGKAARTRKAKTAAMSAEL